MTHFAGRRQPFVLFACPVAQPPSFLHSSCSSGPAASWISPCRPPPPNKVVFAAFTTASTACLVMSPSVISILSEILVILMSSLPLPDATHLIHTLVAAELLVHLSR